MSLVRPHNFICPSPLIWPVCPNFLFQLVRFSLVVREESFLSVPPKFTYLINLIYHIKASNYHMWVLSGHPECLGQNSGHPDTITNNAQSQRLRWVPHLKIGRNATDWNYPYLLFMEDHQTTSKKPYPTHPSMCFLILHNIQFNWIWN